LSVSTRQGEGKRTVLVVSGEARLPRLVKVALEPGRFQIVAARSREEALDLVAVDEPALVVVEMEQADGDGVAVCRSLRELSDVPVINNLRISLLPRHEAGPAPL
jgi:DNA-binding response OmpR family regulator